MSKDYGRKAKGNLPHSKDRKQASAAGVEKAKSDREWGEPREMGMGLTIQGRHVSIHMGSVLGTE